MARKICDCIKATAVGRKIQSMLTQEILRHPLIAWGALFCSLLLTAAAGHILTTNISRSVQDRFAADIADIEIAIRDRMAHHRIALEAGVGFVHIAEDRLDQHIWKDFVDTLNLDENLPGLLGYGYAEMLQPGEVDDYISRMRNLGFRNFKVKPAGERDVYSSISFLEPFNKRNSRAHGFDMYSEATRRTAMEKARDTGEPAISGRVTLVQEIDADVQAGFLMYVPVYRKGMPTATQQQRRLALKGFVYSPFRVDDLMAGILGQGKQAVDFTITDGQSKLTPPNSLLYDSAAAHKRKAQKSPELARTSAISVDGYPWVLNFTSSTDYRTTAELTGPPAVIGASLLVDGLLFWLISWLASGRRYAEQLVQRRTEECQIAKAKAEELAESEVEMRKRQEVIILQLHHANKSLSRFASIAAHDLNGPVRRVDAMVGILLEEHSADLAEEAKDILARISKSAKRMLAMVAGLLSYSKFEAASLQHREFQLCDLIEGVVDDQIGLDDDAQVEISCEPSIGVFGDRTLLEHVLHNLISNSLKYRDKRPLVIDIEASQCDDCIAISISDNGIGIEPEFAEKVFEMFCRLHTEDAYQGLGIGLAVCQRIILDHGGTIWVDKDFVEGTRVVFTVPAAKGKAPNARLRDGREPETVCNAA